MRFAFTEEQDELRRQARALLEEREPSWDELAELGWLGVSVPEESGGAGLGFVEEAVLFEELGRALYPGPYFATVGVALPQLLARRAGARRPRGAEVRDGRGLARRAGHEGARVHGARRRGGRHRAEGARARRRAREVARAVRQADRHLPGRLPPDRRHVRRDRARALAHLLGGVVRGRGRGRTRRSRRSRRRRRLPRPPSPRASARSRCTAASASRGSTRSTATTSGRSGSRPSAAIPRSSAQRSPPAARLDLGVKTVLITGASTGIGAACATRFAAGGCRVLAGVRKAGDAPAGTEELILDVTDAGADRRGRRVRRPPRRARRTTRASPSPRRSSTSRSTRCAISSR